MACGLLPFKQNVKHRYVRLRKEAFEAASVSLLSAQANNPPSLWLAAANFPRMEPSGHLLKGRQGKKGFETLPWFRSWTPRREWRYISSPCDQQYRPWPSLDSDRWGWCEWRTRNAACCSAPDWSRKMTPATTMRDLIIIIRAGRRQQAQWNCYVNHFSFNPSPSREGSISQIVVTFAPHILYMKEYVRCVQTRAAFSEKYTSATPFNVTQGREENSNALLHIWSRRSKTKIFLCCDPCCDCDMSYISYLHCTHVIER